MEYGFKKISVLIFWISPIVAFSQENAISREQKKFEIPNNYNDLPYGELAKVVISPVNCETEYSGMSDERFKTHIKLKGKSFLATVCETGVYQDFAVTFLIVKEKGKTYAHSLAWLEPVFVDNQWKLAPTYEMSSSIHITESGKYLLNKRRYVSRWTCGFNAYYSLPLSDDEFIKPDRVEADNDCDNGIRYDGWPEIDVSKMEVLSKQPVYQLDYQPFYIPAYE